MADGDRFTWTTGGDKNLSHRRYIASGGSGSVHEIFARKLLPLFRLESGAVRNEVRAIEKLCNGTHENIVQVFGIGELPDSSHVFIDMQLCSFNLDQYNKSCWIVGTTSKNPLHDQVWDIMSQIAGGLSFIHSNKEVHRDLKPQNDKFWKLADFGLTSEATSHKLQATEFGRGTPGYRAPELLNENHHAYYTNRVDIWAMGCILYELAVGSKLFASDFTVLEHYRSGDSLQIVDTIKLSQSSRGELANYICQMIQFEPSVRPGAQVLFERFTAQDALAKVSTSPMTNAANQMPPLQSQQPALAPSTAANAKVKIIEKPLKVFRLREPLELLSKPTGEGQGGSGWTVSALVVDITNTRLATVSHDDAYTLNKAQLWDIVCGKPLWSQQESIILSGLWPASPSFSEGGGYLVVYIEKSVAVIDAKLGTVVRMTEELQYVVTALAIAPNGRTFAVSTEEKSEGISATLATHLLPSREKNTGSFRVHLVTSSWQFSQICMAYTHGGRYLRFFGTAGEEKSNEPGVKGRRLTSLWETASLTPLEQSLLPIRINWLAPLYNVNLGNTPTLTTAEYLYRHGSAIHLLDIKTSSAVCRGQIVFSITQGGVLALNDGGMFCSFDSTTNQWGRDLDLKSCYDTNEGRMYKYLWLWSDRASQPICVAKVPWFGLPPIHELKGVAWTNKGLMVITDDLRFLTFVEQDYGGRAELGEVEKLDKLAADVKDKMTSAKDIDENGGISFKKAREDIQGDV